MGEIFLAEDVALERKVAIKFLPENLQQDPVARERFRREANAAAALDHLFICKIYEIAEVDRKTCIVMEHVLGETLERRLRKGTLPLPYAVEIADEMTEALAEAHRRRFVHRDLKPSNIMLTKQGHVKVMDFGLAKQLSEAPTMSDETKVASVGLTQAGTRVGTPGYMSPEQVLGGEVDGRSDIFAFGIVFYELLTGVHPFREASPSEILSATLCDPLVPATRYRKDIPEAMNLVLDKLLAKEAVDRYQTFRDVRQDVRPLLMELTGRAAAALGASKSVETAAAGKRALCVGRDSERAELRRLLDQAVGGRGALILVGGEPGAGKTRLIEEVPFDARQRGCLVLTGRWHETEGTPPFIPFVEALEQACRIVPASAFREALGDAAPEVARLMPELRRLFSDIPAPVELPAAQQRRFLLNSVQEFLDRISRVTPLAVLLDDLHWADGSTLLLLHHLTPQLSQMPMLVIGIYRDTEPDVERAFARMLETLTRQRLAQRLTLRRLPEAGVQAMLRVLSGQPAPSTLAWAMCLQTEGNPFFVEEVFQHLADERKLFDAQGRWRLDLRLEELDVPEGVRLVIERRIERLSEQGRRVLTAAAVAERVFDLDLLEAIGEAEGDRLVSAIEEAEGARLIIPTSGGLEARWGFANELFRQTLVSSLSSFRRRRLHVRIADALGRVYANALEKRAADLAHHLYQAGAAADPSKTVRYLKLAGDHACTIYANEDVARHYQWALETLGAGQDLGVDPLELREQLSDLLAPMGRRNEVLQHYESLLASHRATDDRPAQARLHRKIGALHWDAGDRSRALSGWQAWRCSRDIPRTSNWHTCTRKWDSSRIFSETSSMRSSAAKGVGTHSWRSSAWASGWTGFRLSASPLTPSPGRPGRPAPVHSDALAP